MKPWKTREKWARIAQSRPLTAGSALAGRIEIKSLQATTPWLRRSAGYLWQLTSRADRTWAAQFPHCQSSRRAQLDGLPNPNPAVDIEGHFVGRIESDGILLKDAVMDRNRDVPDIRSTKPTAVPSEFRHARTRSTSSGSNELHGIPSNQAPTLRASW